MRPRKEPKAIPRKTGPLAGLANRSADCMENVGLDTRAKIEAVMATGMLEPSRYKKTHHSDYAKGDYTCIYNFGWKAYLELCAWLGVPRPVRLKLLKSRCPHCGKIV